MKTHKQLINNIIGQLNGITSMIDNKKDCFETLTQLKAVKSALNSLTNKFLQENFTKCLSTCKNQDELCQKFFSEILKNN